MKKQPFRDAAIDPIVLGHNAFFGVNHLDAAKGNARAAQFEETGRIIDVIRFAAEQNVQAMMMSTHERAVHWPGPSTRLRTLQISAFISWFPTSPSTSARPMKRVS